MISLRQNTLPTIPTSTATPVAQPAIEKIAYLVKPDLKVNRVEQLETPKTKTDKALPLTDSGRRHLNSLGIVGSVTLNKIKNGELTTQQTLERIVENRKKFHQSLRTTELSDEQIELLTDPLFEYLILNEAMTLDQFLNLPGIDARFMQIPVVKKYLNNGMLTVDAAINLESFEFRTMRLEQIQERIDQGLISLDEAIKLTNEQVAELA